MKTLANCSLAEFLRQTNKIRKEVAVFLEQTKILDIRKVLPDLKECKTEEEKREKIQKQSKENISNMLDAMLEENADATVRLLGLLCFKEGEELEELNPVDVIGKVLVWARKNNYRLPERYVLQGSCFHCFSPRSRQRQQG